MGLGEFDLGGLQRLLCENGVDGLLSRHQPIGVIMADVSEIQTIEHDVIVIGAGGAGLRAAVECASQGLNTGLICKSLLGKAHTVMAEGGCAAALGNVARTGKPTEKGAKQDSLEDSFPRYDAWWQIP